MLNISKQTNSPFIMVLSFNEIHLDTYIIVLSVGISACFIIISIPLRQLQSTVEGQLLYHSTVRARDQTPHSLKVNMFT